MQTTVIRQLGLQEYTRILEQMQAFTLNRQADTADEIWITEHPPVYTQGLNGKAEHLLAQTAIPVVASDRGGQITYHGPGQLIIYPLLDVKRLNYGPRQLVNLLEQAMLKTLSQYGVSAYSKPEAPGVYVGEKKIAALGLRIKRGCSYHGLSINNNMDLTPFQNINPCGYAGLQVSQLADYGVDIALHALAVPIIHQIIQVIEA